MSPNPFEDPLKVELTARASIALDAAGHEIITPTLITLPKDSKLVGSLKGDIQSIDGEEKRFIFFVRTNGDKTIPQWLANYSKVAHEMTNCHVYAITPSTSIVLEKSCRTSGAGLLVLTEENTLEHVVDFDEFSPDAEAAEFSESVRLERRRMETKLNVNIQSLNDHHGRVQELTTGLTANLRDEYLAGILAGIQSWTDWGDAVSTLLDEAAGANDSNLLEAARRKIDEGAIEDTNNDVTPANND